MVLLTECGENKAPNAPDINAAFILSVIVATPSSNLHSGAILLILQWFCPQIKLVG